jgi:hypothetical protein
MNKNTLVNVQRYQLSPSLAAHLPNFIFWNPGTVTQRKGSRVLVRWSKEDSFWFDSEALTKE